MVFYIQTKGQLISKADWRAIDSPKKRRDEFVLFAFLLFTANKSNSSIRFLGESTARQSAFWFYLTFNHLENQLGGVNLFLMIHIGSTYDISVPLPEICGQLEAENSKLMTFQGIFQRTSRGMHTVISGNQSILD